MQRRSSTAALRLGLITAAFLTLLSYTPADAQLGKIISGVSRAERAVGVLEVESVAAIKTESEATELARAANVDLPAQAGVEADKNILLAAQAAQVSANAFLDLANVPDASGAVSSFTRGTTYFHTNFGPHSSDGDLTALSLPSGDVWSAKNSSQSVFEFPRDIRKAGVKQLYLDPSVFQNEASSALNLDAFAQAYVVVDKKPYRLLQVSYDQKPDAVIQDAAQDQDDRALGLGSILDRSGFTLHTFVQVGPGVYAPAYDVTAIRTWNTLSHTAFNRNDVRIIPIVQSDEPTRQLLLRNLPNETYASQISSESALESAFAGYRGKTVFILGHFEHDSFAYNGVSIPRHQIDELAAKYDVTWFPYGCQTASATGGAGTLSIVYGPKVALAFTNAMQAKTITGFWEALKTQDADLVINHTLLYNHTTKALEPALQITFARITTLSIGTIGAPVVAFQVPVTEGAGNMLELGAAGGVAAITGGVLFLVVRRRRQGRSDPYAAAPLGQSP